MLNSCDFLKLFYGIEQVVKKFLLETNDIKNKQPLCHRDLKNYEQEFQQYKPQIEKLIEQNSNLNRLINNYSQIKNYLRSISEDIESISKTICKYKSIAEATIHVNQLETSLHKLKSIQSQLKDFNNEQLSEFDELKTKLKERIQRRLRKTLLF